MTKQIKDQTKQAIRDYTKEHTWKETAEKFNVSEMTISRILKSAPIQNTIEIDLTFLRSLFEDGKITVNKNKITPIELERLEKW
jgi:DNA-binding transcriptional regulator LsrR (DeoR family)